MLMFGVEMTAEWKPATAPREQIIAAGVFAEESQSAPNISLERPNDCLESFIHGWYEQVPNVKVQRIGPHTGTSAGPEA